MELADREIFLNLCLHLKVPSKDENLTTLKPWGTQLYIVDRIFWGLAHNRRHFTIVKCGQSGTTSIALAFVLYWLWVNEGVVGNFVADDDERRHFFNGLVRSYIRSLEEVPDFCIPVRSANRMAINFANESVLNFSHANRQKKGKLGRGIGSAVLHATECAFWEDEGAFETLLERISMVNRSALAIFESTANGHNFWKEKWEVARRSTEQLGIFVGWWLHDRFRFKRGSSGYETYWETEPVLGHEERRWVEVVKRRYGWGVDSEQMAWWRAKVAEIYGGDLGAMYQENPPTEDYAFQFSGRTFLDKGVLNARIGEVGASENVPRCFRFLYSENFLEMRMVELAPESPYVELKVWEAPTSGKGVVYSIGVDPCHGTAQESADAAVCILRCYADRLEQVAEFRSKGLEPYKLARVLLYLAAAYSNDTMFGLEVQGGGSETFQEMERIKQRSSEGFSKEILKHFGRLNTYMYSRVDAARKSFASKHFHTTERVRYEVLEIVRTCTSDLKRVVLHSRELIDQIGLLKRMGPGANRPGEVEPRVGIDLVMAYGFSLKIWDEHLRYKLQNTVYTYGYEEFVRERDKTAKGQVGYSLDDLITERLLNWKRGVGSGVVRVVG